MHKINTLRSSLMTGAEATGFIVAMALVRGMS